MSYLPTFVPTSHSTKQNIGRKIRSTCDIKLCDLPPRKFGILRHDRDSNRLRRLPHPCLNCFLAFLTPFQASRSSCLVSVDVPLVSLVHAKFLLSITLRRLSAFILNHPCSATCFTSHVALPDFTNASDTLSESVRFFFLPLTTASDSSNFS
jgi:hypothetical protein